MSPVERKKIEDVAKKAGIKEDDVPKVVDLEMRINMIHGETESVIEDMLVIDFMSTLFWNKHIIYR